MADFTKVEQWMENLLQLGIPLCQVEVKQRHQTLFKAQKGPVNEGDRFLLYSCTKLMTVAGMLRLIEQGKARLSDPVSRYIPSFKDAFILRDGVPCAPEQEMTLHHLFTMTGGLDYDMSAPAIQEAARQEGATTLSIAAAFPKKALSFSPGDKFQYSLCHDALGGVIESITGLSLADYFEQEIFAPLGMKDSSFHPGGPMAPHYAFNWDTKVIEPQDINRRSRPAPGYFSGGAGVYSTIADLSIFLDALACGKGANGYRLLQADTIRLLRQDQLPLIARDTSFGCSSGPGYSYGLGVRTMVDNSKGQRSPIGEFGWDGAGGCYALCDHDNGLSIAFTMQVLGWVGIQGASHNPIRDAVYEALNL